MTSYDVKFWEIYANKRTDSKTGKTKTVSHTVRWTVAGRRHSKTLRLKSQAESHLSDLRQAAKRGEAFDIETGAPESKMPTSQPKPPDWFTFAQGYMTKRWPDLAANSRDGLSEALATVTPVLCRDDVPGKPDPAVLRTALRKYALLPAERRPEPSPEIGKALVWVRRAALPVDALEDVGVTHRALEALAQKLDGKPTATKTYQRKRADLYSALQYAVALDFLSSNPLDNIKVKATTKPKRSTAIKRVDRRVVVNPRQGRELLTGVSYVGRTLGLRLRGFFACMYYAALRPEEVLGLREADCTLPNHGWGLLLVAETRAARRRHDLAQRRCPGPRRGRTRRTQRQRSPPGLRRLPRWSSGHTQPPDRRRSHPR